LPHPVVEPPIALRKSHVISYLDLPRFGVQAAAVAGMRQVLTIFAHLSETHGLLLLGTILIVAAAFFRRFNALHPSEGLKQNSQGD
jgi:hypothetical protein